MNSINAFVCMLILVVLVSCQQNKNTPLNPSMPNSAAREGGGGVVIILDDINSIPTYNSITLNYTSNTQGEIQIQNTLAANCEDVLISFKLPLQTTWTRFWVREPYANGTVNVQCMLSCLNANTTYNVKITALPYGSSGSLYVTGAACVL